MPVPTPKATLLPAIASMAISSCPSSPDHHHRALPAPRAMHQKRIPRNSFSPSATILSSKASPKVSASELALTNFSIVGVTERYRLGRRRHSSRKARNKRHFPMAVPRTRGWAHNFPVLCVRYRHSSERIPTAVSEWLRRVRKRTGSEKRASPVVSTSRMYACDLMAVYTQFS